MWARVGGEGGIDPTVARAVGATALWRRFSSPSGGGRRDEEFLVLLPPPASGTAIRGGLAVFGLDRIPVNQTFCNSSAAETRFVGSETIRPLTESISCVLVSCSAELSIRKRTRPAQYSAERTILMADSGSKLQSLKPVSGSQNSRIGISNIKTSWIMQPNAHISMLQSFSDLKLMAGV